LETTTDLANDPARKRLIAQQSSVNTLAEANAAIEAVKQWRREHPKDFGILDGGEILSHLKDYEEWKLANPEEWTAEQEVERRAIAAHQPERERMLRDALGARTAAELDRAEQALFQWNADYPEDAGRELSIVEALEQVLTRRAALATQEEPVLAGRAA